MNENGQELQADEVLTLSLMSDGKMNVSSRLQRREIVKALQNIAMEILYQDIDERSKPAIAIPNMVMGNVRQLRKNN